MDKRIQQHYERELRFLRELGAEFARNFPKVAGRLGVGELANEDPHVERLFQGFAFLSGRIQQRLDAEFPAFSETLLEQIYGHLLKPTPSMVVVQFQPTPNDSSLASGFTLPRGTELRARSSLASSTVCQYRTAHAVELWPIKIDSIEYTSVLRSIADLRLPAREPIRALLRIGLSVTGGRSFNELQLKSLPLYVGGADEKAARLYEALVAHVGTSVIARWGPRPAEHVAFGDEAPATRQLGFAANQALLPAVQEAFDGYRLLHEYFAFATRFRFVELRGLGSGVRCCSSDRLELILPLRHCDGSLEGELELDRLQLFATPAVNLFSRRCDVIGGQGFTREVKVVPDRTQPLDYEVHTVTRVASHVSGRDLPREYRPLHTVHGRLERDQLMPHYALERRPRMVAYDEQRAGARTAYAGTEVYLRLSEPSERTSFASQQLIVEALCTNSGLPLLLSRDRQSYFTLSTGAPVDSVRCLSGPSAPRSLAVDGETTWRLISYLKLNYLSLNEETGGSGALRDLLELYARFGDPLLRREVDGIRAVTTRPVIGPYPQPGPQRFVRGLEVALQCEEQAFAHGALTLASVLAVLFAKQVTPHSFTQTVLHTVERGEVYRSSALPGVAHAL